MYMCNWIEDYHGKNRIQQEEIFHQQTGLKLGKKDQEKCYIWSIALYGVETCTLRKLDKKYLEKCWRMMEKLISTDRVRNEELLHIVEEERNILRTIKKGWLTWLVTYCTGTAF